MTNASDHLDGQTEILVVDDTLENIQVLSGMLKQKGYKVRPVTSGKMALQTARHSPPDLVLLDISMPEMDGYEVCTRMKADPGLKDIPILFISALSDTSDIVKAFTLGGEDYIAKPFKLEEVLKRVETHLQKRNQQLRLEEYNRHLEELVETKSRELTAVQMATIQTLAELVDYRDESTGQHVKRVQYFCKALALRLSTKPAYSALITLAMIENIYHASALHDIGKIAVSDAILLKPGKLTPEEFEKIKLHTIKGAQFMEGLQRQYPQNEFVKLGIVIARSHHERWDGTGYPDGLKGEAIPLSARIMALADVYDALRSVRPYKAAFAHEESCQIILAGCGTHFDPGMTETFIEIEAEFDQIRERFQ